MEMRINELTQTAPAEAARQTTEADGAFKFVLASHIDDAGLQEKINALMNEISEQGKKISKKTDVREMKSYTAHMNSPEKIFWTEGEDTGYMESSV